MTYITNYTMQARGLPIQNGFQQKTLQCADGVTRLRELGKLSAVGGLVSSIASVAFGYDPKLSLAVSLVAGATWLCFRKMAQKLEPQAQDLIKYFGDLHNRDSERQPLSSISEGKSQQSLLADSMESSSRSIDWTVENRGGIAKLVGFLMVPSQFLGPKFSECQQIINSACQYSRTHGGLVRQIQIEHKAGLLNVVICYPRGWDPDDSSRCVVYHNPNGATVAQFFENNRLSHVAGAILDLRRCPIILYDYQGTGLNENPEEISSLKFRPTYESIVEDGLCVLNYALKTFTNVDVWGSSLGGGVATASLERYLAKNPSEAGRVSITNHDSFTTTSRVVLPGSPQVADCLGWMLGGNLDAQTPMESLVKRGVKVTVLCHEKDPVIPPGARMAEFVSQFADEGNLSVINSPKWGHAHLSYDMLADLR